MTDKSSRVRIGRENGRWQLRICKRTENGLDDPWLNLGHVEDPKIAIGIWMGLISRDDKR